MHTYIRKKKNLKHVDAGCLSRHDYVSVYQDIIY